MRLGIAADELFEIHTRRVLRFVAVALRTDIPFHPVSFVGGSKADFAPGVTEMAFGGISARGGMQ